jgi:glutamine phosphoribosylpyrophosphate amidotransferase
MEKIKNNFEWIITAIIITLIVILGILISGCGEVPKIETGDKVEKCVVDSVYVTNSRSTIEPESIYHYKTSCGYVLVTKRNAYKIGDTITYVFKETK